MTKKKGRGSYKDSCHLRECILGQLEQLFGLWMIENFLCERSCCIYLPDYVGKTKKELKSIFPHMYYTTTERFLEELNNKKERDGLPEEVSDDIKALFQEREWPERSQEYPDYFGTFTHGKRNYMVSFNDKGIVTDAFYVDLSMEMLKCFNRGYLFLFINSIRELTELGFEAENFDKTQNYLLHFLSRHVIEVINN